MGRKVLFLACCHHMHELLAKDTCYKIFQKDDSPQCKLFMDLKRELDLFQRRHDYKELLEVSLKLHGPSCQQEFTWKKVGAVNKARFMAWSLCSVKAFAFSSLMDFSKETKENLQCFTLFQVTIYIPHILMSSI